MQSTQRKETEPHIGAVILAAGDSKRLGQPKQLLIFRDRTFIETVIETAIAAKLAPIIVIVGYEAKMIQKKINKYGDNLVMVMNNNWREGQSSSLRVAIPHIINSSHTIFFLIDQPQICLAHIEKLIKTSVDSSKLIIATYVGDRRANPVSFSKVLYNELSTIQGDQGGRFLFTKYEVEKLQWDDERILIDVDTLEDYERLKSAYEEK
jgi:molybdenum cofactor cytidylyltransferase